MRKTTHIALHCLLFIPFLLSTPSVYPFTNFFNPKSPSLDFSRVICGQLITQVRPSLTHEPYANTIPLSTFVIIEFSHNITSNPSFQSQTISSSSAKATLSVIFARPVPFTGLLTFSSFIRVAQLLLKEEKTSNLKDKSSCNTRQSASFRVWSCGPREQISCIKTENLRHCIVLSFCELKIRSFIIFAAISPTGLEELSL
jgi:hypothetical protein